MAMVGLALVASACSGGAVSSGGAISLRLPTDPLQGCTYTVNGQVASYLPTGLDPHYASFSPDPSAESALGSIKSKGGTGIVDIVILPAGVKLRSGPSLSAPAVATVGERDQLELYDPILWTDAMGDRWLASFVACGGGKLYWTSLDDLQKTNPGAAQLLRTQLVQLRNAPPYSRTARASLLPIVINSSSQVVWKDRSVAFNVGRAEVVSAV